MKQDLVLNLVPIELAPKAIYVGPDTGGGKDLIDPESVGQPASDTKVAWDLNEFENSVRLMIGADQVPMMKRLVGRYLRDFLLQQPGLIVAADFIGSIVALEFSHANQRGETNVYKKYSVRVLAPRDQHACKRHSWHLNVSYEGETEIATASMSTVDGLREVTRKAIVGRTIKRIAEVTDQDVAGGALAVVNRDVAKLLKIQTRYTKVANKYARQFEESVGFYDKYLRGKNVSDLMTVYTSGFQTISDGQLRAATKDSNLLLFGENHTHFNPYNGLKEYGPYQSVQSGYKFFFVFHKDDAAYANKLHACLNRGLKGFPGLYRFVGLNLDLDKEKTIRFSDENPVNQVTSGLNGIKFDEKTRYLAIYISRINRDDPDDEKRAIYFRLKKAFLEKNISSQVVFRENIELDNFNYFLPNIAIAILAKLGGIPWRLSRPIRHDLVVGLGAFRESNNVLLGTTVAFKNDGTFIKFDANQVNTVADLVSFFERILSSVAHEFTDVRRLVVHFYKQMNRSEERAVSMALEKLNLKIPYLVATINEESQIVPFDASYSGRMPVSGTCVVLRRGDYLLCNNTRYSEMTGARIDDFPFPVRIRISKSSIEDLADEDIQHVIDQAYQFSRMYWVSVKQKGKPVTILYSERVAAISAAFEDRQLPQTETATKSLWFL